MVQLTIRDVPEPVKDALVSQARVRGQSLQAYVLDVLRRQADFSWNRDVLAQVEAEFGHGRGVGDAGPRAADVLADERAGRGDSGSR